MAYIDIYRARSSMSPSSSSNDYLSDELLRSLISQLASSPNSVTAEIDGVTNQVLLTSKSNSANKDLKNVSALNEAGLSPGDTFTTLDESWLVLEEHTQVVGDYFKGVVVRTNYNLKWIDIYGVIHSSVAFATGKMSSFVGDFWETTPVYLETTSTNVMIIMPSGLLENHDKLMFNGKSWKIVNIDNESIQGLAFISVEDVPVNLELDNTALNIANYYETRNWTIEIQNNDTLELLVAETVTIVPVVKLNGVVQEEACEITSTPSYSTISGLAVTGASLGTESLTVALSGNTTISQDISVDVVESKSVSRTVYIEGTQSVSPLSTYSLNGYEVVDGESAPTAGTFEIITDTDDIISSMTVVDTSTVSILIAESGIPGQTASIRFTSVGETDTIILTVKSFWT